MELADRSNRRGSTLTPPASHACYLPSIPVLQSMSVSPTFHTSRSVPQCILWFHPLTSTSLLSPVVQPSKCPLLCSHSASGNKARASVESHRRWGANSLPREANSLPSNQPVNCGEEREKGKESWSDYTEQGSPAGTQLGSETMAAVKQNPTSWTGSLHRQHTGPMPGN